MLYLHTKHNMFESVSYSRQQQQRWRGAVTLDIPAIGQHTRVTQIEVTGSAFPAWLASNGCSARFATTRHVSAVAAPIGHVHAPLQAMRVPRMKVCMNLNTKLSIILVNRSSGKRGKVFHDSISKTYGLSFVMQF